MKLLAKNITERQTDSMRLFASRTGVRDIVSIAGSVMGGANMLPRTKRAAAFLAGELLDAGTKGKSKDSIREALSARGITLSFSAGGNRTSFSASCLPEDLSFVLNMVAECLGESVFPAKEVLLAKERAAADLKEEKSDTEAQGSQALTRLLYDPSHVNFIDETTVRARNLSALDRKDLVDFARSFSRNGLVLAMTGDIEPIAAIRVAEKAFAKLPAKEMIIPVRELNSKNPEAYESIVSIKDKANIDTFMGVSVPLTLHNSLYQPFAFLMGMLGGSGFTNHLMMTLRERDGLCYHIRALPAGFGDEADGYLRINATFSPEKYEQSIAALRKEIGVFFKKGITQDKLDERKVVTRGSFSIGLSTSRGLAVTLHQIGAEGRDLSYIDDYLNIINSLTVKDLQEAAALIPLDRLSLAAAGTFVK